MGLRVGKLQEKGPMNLNLNISDENSTRQTQKETLNYLCGSRRTIIEKECKSAH
jgi:hypothetical protein